MKEATSTSITRAPIGVRLRPEDCIAQSLPLHPEGEVAGGGAVGLEDRVLHLRGETEFAQIFENDVDFYRSITDLFG